MAMNPIVRNTLAVIAGVMAAYFPMGYLGAMLAGSTSSRSAK